jgi:hypothetical protein
MLHLREHVHQPGQIVAVDRAHVLDAHRLEDLPRPHRVLHAVLEVVPHLLDAVADRRRQLMDDLLADALEFFVRGGDADALEVLAERALGLADAHPVVVEDDQQLPLERAGVVEPFERQAVDDRRIADDGDDVAVLLQMRIAPRHADGGADGGAGVADGEQVVRRLFRCGEAADAALLAQPIEQRRAAGEHLVRVTLMADVEEQAIGAFGIRAEVVDVVQREGQFDDAEVRREVPAVVAHGGEDAVAHLLGERLQLIGRELSKIGRGLNALEH